MEEDYGLEDKGLDRVLALSDGVFAFSLTLLALSLIVPHISSTHAGAELSQKLIEEIPNFIIFFWSFFIVSFYWTGHHRVFRYIQRYDGVLIWCNLIMLMFITIVPFITNLNMLYGDLQVAVVVSAVFYAIPGVAISVLWSHASKHHRLIATNLSDHMITLTRHRNYVAPLIFLFSIPLSFIHPYVTLAFWLTMMPLRIIIERHAKSLEHRAH